MNQTLIPKAAARKYTAEEMFDLIARCKNSGQAVQSFCRLHGLTEARYYYWQKKYLNQTKNAGEATEENFSFVKLGNTISNNGVLSLFAEVNGIRLYKEVPASYLKELIR